MLERVIYDLQRTLGAAAAAPGVGGEEHPQHRHRVDVAAARLL